MTRHTIIVTACVSVLLNILLIGMVLGHIYSEHPHHRPHSKKLETVLAQLPEEKALWYKDAVRKERKNQWEMIKAIKKTRHEAVEIFVAEQFDAVAFSQKLHQLDELGANIKRQKMTVIIEFAEQLSAAERVRLSTFLLRDRRFDNKP